MATTEESARSAAERGRPRPRRPARRPGAQGPRRQPPVHPLRRPPVLAVRRLQGGGHRDRRRPPRAVGRVRRRGLGEGDPRGRRLRAHRRPRRHQRDERDRGGASPTARRSSCSAAAPPRAAGARARFRRSTTCRSSSPLVKSAETVKATGRDPGRDLRGDRHRPRPADRADLPRLSARRRLHRGRGRAAAAPPRPAPRRAADGAERAASCSPRPSAR